jgi:hypothetical protein
MMAISLRTTWFGASAAAVALWLGLVVNAAADDAKYAVIAYSESSRLSVAVVDRTSRQQADRDAIASCVRKSGTVCKEVVYSSKSKHCVALVIPSTGNGYAGASAPTIDAATAKATSRMAQLTSLPTILAVAVCNS